MIYDCWIANFASVTPNFLYMICVFTILHTHTGKLFSSFKIKIFYKVNLPRRPAIQTKKYGYDNQIWVCGSKATSQYINGVKTSESLHSVMSLMRKDKMSL